VSRSEVGEASGHVRRHFHLHVGAGDARSCRVGWAIEAREKLSARLAEGASVLPLARPAWHAPRFVHAAYSAVIIGEFAPRRCLLGHVKLIIVVSLGLLSCILRAMLIVTAGRITG